MEGHLSGLSELAREVGGRILIAHMRDIQSAGSRQLDRWITAAQVVISIYQDLMSCCVLGDDQICADRSQVLISVCHRFACLF